ncbi:cytochrome c [Salicibibacter cibarius]|uniref:Cytochrome c n=1 Tax=Salicibibacter cibarius TaxID=2743000 RepID=A0A7T7CCC6_9BACI|nr:cytochrome c [Salicibibacter cibarius]QQK76775.1 cytochrome c [Salicibibacter cibarius]
MKKLMMVMGVSAMLLAACGGEEAAEETEATVNLTEGEELFEENCLSCHGDGELYGMPSDDVLTGIEEGPGPMEPNMLEGEDAENVATYVEDAD